MPRLCALFVTITLLLSAAPGLAAAVRAHTVVPATGTVLEGKGIPPGAVVAIAAGERETLTIRGLRGPEQRPIVVTNGGGLVRVANANRGYAIRVVDCQHVRLTGSGTKGLTYGFSAEATRKGMMAVHVVGRSTNIELDHIEVTGAGFAGFNVKDEPKADGSTNRDAFVMRDIHIHHNYVRDVQGETFYIGHTFYHGHEVKGKKLSPHVIDGLRIHHNRTERTGCEGIQVGSSVGRLEVTDNVIIQPGIAPFAKWQDNGMQINGRGDLYVARNIIVGPPGNGIIGGALGDDYQLRVERNLVVDAGGYAGYLGKQNGAGGTVEIVNNTFVGAGKGGYRIANGELGRLVVVNNLLAGVSGSPRGLAGADIVEAGNLVLPTVAAAGLRDPQAGDGELHVRSPARKAGIAIDRLKVGPDPLGRQPGPGAVDVGAWASSVRSR